MVESELSEISSELIRTTVRETVENELKSNNYKINVSSASQSGDNNFIGVVYRVSFCKEKKIENGVNSISKLILKVAPQNVARREQFMSRPCFLREIYLYNEVLPYFREFEESKGVIVDENGFTEYPKCFRTVDIELDECVLLEDLSVSGFKMIDRYTEEVKADHVYLMMKLLAKYHAISFALKDQQPEKFKELSSNLDEIFFCRDSMLRDYFLKQSEDLSNVVSGDEDAHLLEKVKKLLQQHPMDVTADCFETGRDAAVIAHGDTWQNNVMYKYDNNGKPIDIRLIDWQIARHVSPIIDIVYFIFFCTTKELRDAHYDDFLKTYHETLSKHITKLGSDPETLFPYKLMLEHFHSLGKVGLILATVMLPIIMKDSAQEINLDEISEDVVGNKKELDASIFLSIESNKRYNQRLREIIIDMVRLEYI
ncbi:uncharacterized protein LOC116343426 [Contarinia nasturtii]|uniref:uncharacterized protein LOC116343426 n=1 Tax=Contarinia nasturtii TaxID=265458 RepID=UPI0012D48211|nr:uncharacterized protein LOC116343426 [Contarinia nasturtii]